MGVKNEITISGAERVGDLRTALQQYQDIVKKATDATKPIPAAAPGWDDVSKLKANKKIYNSGAPDKAVTILNTLKKAYLSAGVPPAVTDFLLIQDWMESGGFTNTGAKLNNPGNIMWPSRGLKYGSKGPYNTINKTYYAKFASLAEFVREKLSSQVLDKGPGYPLKATTLADFAHRLKLNSYYGSQSESSYLAALRNAGQTINNLGLLHADAHQKIVKDAGVKKGLPWWAWGLIGVGGIIVIKEVTS